MIFEKEANIFNNYKSVFILGSSQFNLYCLRIRDAFINYYGGHNSGMSQTWPQLIETFFLVTF